MRSLIHRGENRVMKAVGILHVRLFGQDMGEEMKGFIGNLSWSFWGGLIASAVMMAINIAGGRLLGPEEYGKYNLALTWANIIMLPMISLINMSSVRAIARSGSFQGRAKHISSAFYFTIAVSGLLAMVFIFAREVFSSRMAADVGLISFSFLLALVLGFKTVMDGFVRGLGFFRFQAVGRVLEVTAAGLIFAFIYYFSSFRGYGDYVFVLSASAVVLMLWYLKRLYRYFKKFDLGALLQQISYGKVILLGTVAGTVFNSLDKLLIANYLNVFQLGLYGAYFTVSTNLIAQVSQMFVNVFFPAVSKEASKREVLIKINKLIRLGCVPVFVCLFGIIYVAMRLFGAEYQIILGYVFGFAVLATLQLVQTVNTAFITAVSKSLFSKYMWRFNAINIVHIFLYGVLIFAGYVSVGAIVVLLVMNVGVNVIIQRSLLMRYTS